MVKRYYIAGYDDCGLVLHSDYASLEQERDTLKRQLEIAMNTIDESTRIIELYNRNGEKP